MNIEGLAATPAGELLIGFRNPVRDKKSLIVPLNNPRDVVAGKPVKFGEPVRLSLEGRGIRSLDYVAAQQGYLIIAGSHAESGEFRLYRWSGSTTEDPTYVSQVSFAGLQPEAIVSYADEPDRVQVLSDDGTRPIDGDDCKAADASQRRFRSVWVKP